MNEKAKDVLQATDAEAIRLAKTLLRSARYAALAVLDPESGAPVGSRVALATDLDGIPIILVSALSAHTGSLLADARCSLLVGEPGKGDPLAHPRMTIACRAMKLERGNDDQARAERRYLNRHPKEKLYAGFADFSYFRLAPVSASLNGGFAKAYALTAGDLLSSGPAVEGLATSEQGAIDHMNQDHRDAIALYARYFAKAGDGDWSISGIDPDGLDLVLGDRTCRVFFGEMLANAGDLRSTLVTMSREARQAS